MIRDNPGRLVPEETFTNSHPSGTSCFLYHLSPFATVHGILFIQLTCLTVLTYNLFPGLLWSSKVQTKRRNGENENRTRNQLEMARKLSLESVLTCFLYLTADFIELKINTWIRRRRSIQLGLNRFSDHCCVHINLCPLTGNVWIYRSYGKFSSDPASSDFCHPVLYAYAFWLTTSTYILVALFCCLVCISGGLCGRQTNASS